MKRGETILWHVQDELGDISEVTITAALARVGFYQELTVTPDDLSVGTYTITGPDTSDFPVGIMSCDIEYVVDGVTDLSNTFRVNVQENITR
ncbi:MAG: hypothetical protein ACPG4X_19305 [Pikeienuella sp.]